MTRAILVNGVPATGKTNIAKGIAKRLHCPVMTLDSVKEVLFEELGDRDADREWGRTLGRASIRSIWALIGGFPADAMVVVEAWFRLPPHDPVLTGLTRARVDQWVEVWCHGDPDVIAARYAGRKRHPGHPAPEDYVEELRALAGRARPMALSPVLDVDTTDFATVDLDAIVRWVADQLPPGGDQRVQQQ